MSWPLTSFSFARIRFEIVMRFTQDRPPLVVAQMCVKPGKPDVSSLPGGVPPELDQPRLARVQFQPELREPAAQLCQELVSEDVVQVHVREQR